MPDEPKARPLPIDEAVDQVCAGVWHRRQGHEHAIHAYDAQLAVGTVRPIDAGLAVDGIGLTDPRLAVAGDRAAAHAVLRAAIVP